MVKLCGGKYMLIYLNDHEVKCIYLFASLHGNLHRKILLMVQMKLE